MIDYETIRSDTRGRVGWITLHRPEALNALNTTVMREVVDAATRFDADERIGAIVLTLRHRTDIKRQDVLAQMYRDPAKAMEVVDVKPGQGL